MRSLLYRKLRVFTSLPLHFNVCIKHHTANSISFLRLNNFSHAAKQLETTSSSWGSNKQHRKVKVGFLIDMTDPDIEKELAPLRANVKQQVST